MRITNPKSGLTRWYCAGHTQQLSYQAHLHHTSQMRWSFPKAEL